MTNHTIFYENCLVTFWSVNWPKPGKHITKLIVWEKAKRFLKVVFHSKTFLNQTFHFTSQSGKPWAEHFWQFWEFLSLPLVTLQYLHYCCDQTSLSISVCTTEFQNKNQHNNFYEDGNWNEFLASLVCWRAGSAEAEWKNGHQYGNQIWWLHYWKCMCQISPPVGANQWITGQQKFDQVQGS